MKFQTSLLNVSWLVLLVMLGFAAWIFAELGSRLSLIRVKSLLIFTDKMGAGLAYFRDAAIDHIWCWWICSVNREWSALRKTWTAKILHCIHVHWRSVEENKSLTWPNDLSNMWLDLTLRIFWCNFTLKCVPIWWFPPSRHRKLKSNPWNVWSQEFQILSHIDKLTT